MGTGLATVAPAQSFPGLQIWPHGGNPGQDSDAIQWFGDAPTAQCLQMGAEGYTFDCQCQKKRHYGVDIGIASFAQKRGVGVPVFAVANGVVYSVVDGNCDECMDYICGSGTEPPVRLESRATPACQQPRTGCPLTTEGCTGATANHVFLYHGLNPVTGKPWVTKSSHLRRGSIGGLQVGDCVLAGQQIGLVGSSGASHWPHTHFQVDHDNTAMDPFIGSCNPSPPVTWKSPPTLSDLRLFYVGVSRLDKSAIKPPQPRFGDSDDEPDGWVTTADQTAFVWGGIIRTADFGAGSATCSYELVNPGQVAVETIGNETLHVGQNVPFHHTVTWTTSLTVGSWAIRMALTPNGQTTPTYTVDLPLEVLPAGSTTSPNRAPEPVSAALQPATPTADEPIECRVSSPIVGDKDYDIIRYTYVWKVSTTNGIQTVRTITHHGRGDAIPRQPAGSTVWCEVTAADIRGGVTSTVATDAATVSPADLSSCPSLTRIASGRWLDLGSDHVPGAGPRLTGSPHSGVSNTRFEVARGTPEGGAILVLSTTRAGLSLAPGAPHLTVPITLDRDGHGSALLQVPCRAPLFARAWVFDPAGAAASSNILHTASVIPVSGDHSPGPVEPRR